RSGSRKSRRLATRPTRPTTFPKSRSFRTTATTMKSCRSHSTTWGCCGKPRRRESRPADSPHAPLTRQGYATAFRLLSAGLLLMPAALARAEDKVVLQRNNSTARLTISGTIEDYTGTELTIRVEADEVPKTFPASDVVEIQTAQLESHTRGLRLLAE